MYIVAPEGANTIQRKENKHMAKKILVADDSPTELNLMSQPFLKNGFEVVTATDGEEVLAKAEAEKPDLLVIDVIMPKLNGFQVCRKIKTTEATKNIPVILVTSKSQESDKFYGMKQGASAYVTKPFDEQELLKTVKGLL